MARIKKSAKPIIIVTGEKVVDVQRDINTWLEQGWHLKDSLIVTMKLESAQKHYDASQIVYTQVLEKD